MKKHTRFTVATASAVVVSVALSIWIGPKLFSALWPLNQEPEKKPAAAAPAAPQDPRKIVVNKPKYVRGIHMTSWVSGSTKMRAALDQLFTTTELNTAVIDIKEYEGEVYIPGVAQAEQYKSYVPAIPDCQKYIAHLKSMGVYPVARIVVFKDNIVPRKHPEWGVKDANGNLWKDRNNITWFDPYNKEVWDYTLNIADKALDLGFEEIQFDYIRFPSDGNTRTCRYSVQHTTTTSAAALTGFLKAAHDRLKPRGALISIDVFGLTTTVKHDMGIGQRMYEMAQWVDYISPMVYPSHYNKGEYGIPDPNKAPYRTVYLGMSGAIKRMGSAVKLRPYLQDFSLGWHYGAKEVRAQIEACYDNDIPEWILWNPRCAYTRAALKEKKFSETYEKNPAPLIEVSRPKETGRHSGVKKSSSTATAAAVNPSSPSATSAR